MINRRYILVFLFFQWCWAFAQPQTYLVKFTDKASNAYSLHAPSQFMTDRALQRRLKCHVLLDEKDLPVSQTYIDQVASTGAQILYPLKWLNGVVVRSDATIKTQIASFSFVESADQSVKYKAYPTPGTQEAMDLSRTSAVQEFSDVQNNMIGLLRMRDEGYTGEGILIAITDDGFLNADTLTAFRELFNNGQIIDTWDMVDLDKTVYAQGGGHGAYVFSILAGHVPDQLLGPATGAHFLLFRTEDVSSESPLEELNWVRAAEVADSLGTDIIQVSLGYNTFDDTSLDLTTADLDGHTSYISQGASTAATRGIVVVVSAGNAGASSWRKILCPADALGILSVGSVESTKTRSTFSSVGYSADGRVKPDVMAMGNNVVYAGYDGSVKQGGGTSFASPLITGLSAGLLQAYPKLSHSELIQAIKYSADRYEHPDSLYGYGIPNFHEAFRFAQLLLDQQSELVFPNPFNDQLNIKIAADGIGYRIYWTLYTINGKEVVEGEQIADNTILPLYINGNALSAGVYCLKVSYNNHFSTFRVIK